MQRSLWAPWRLAYIQSLGAQDAPSGSVAGAPTSGANFLAEYWAHPERDREQFVVHRDHAGMVLLNRYPYANGHLLVALGRPRGALVEYAPDERAHFWRLMDLAMALCEEACAPQGMNAGLNVGRAAGAGLPEHVHGHVVPRWAGDCNFLSVLGEVRVIPDALERSWERYRAALPASLARIGAA
jgi:ATP adenylyltransferase